MFALLFHPLIPGAVLRVLLSAWLLWPGFLTAFKSSREDTFPTAAGRPAAQELSLFVNVSANRRPISPYIYGMNFTDEVLAQELRLPVRRWGGNATTRYNWQHDTSNRGADWFFENIPNPNPHPEALPKGSASDRFVEQDRRTGTKTLLTIPLIGWTPRDRTYAACAFPVSKYGSQQKTDPYQADCGNGVNPRGVNISGNDPNDTSRAIGPAFVQDWVKHLVRNYGTAAQGGVAFYSLDNEPMLWHHTHRDVFPNRMSYDKLRDLTYAYGAAIKAADPGAATLGPVLWGWTAYFYSALDEAPGGRWWENPQDRNRHGGMPLVPWYLQQMRAYEEQHHVRLLDYLDLHFYPQQAEVALSPAGSARTQALRLRSSRALWDPTYKDESWINAPVRLIPRMREWVNQYYPGTRLAISEYNWGALDHINGALAQADILGIFGREGLDLATLWEPPRSNQPGAFAFRLYRNYDRAGSTFGNISVQATSADQDKLAIYAAQRSKDGVLTLMIINKSTETLAGNLNLNGFNPSPRAAVFRYSGENPNEITRPPDQAVTGGGFKATFPAASITLIAVQPASPFMVDAPVKVYLPLLVKPS